VVRRGSRKGFAVMKNKATIAASPTNQKAGAIAAIARPPSKGTTGIRLIRLRKNAT
jgi:hypothetical protein